LVHSALTFYLDNDWFENYEGVVARLAQIQHKSKNKVMLELLKKQIEDNRRLFDSKLTDFRVEQDLQHRPLLEDEIVCKECGAKRKDVDKQGFVIHDKGCSSWWFKNVVEISGAKPV